ncbi:MAG: HAD family hydrolase [Clostridiales bacterium]|jgi:D-glycero-D-manno-heptose 1,7-bisphosphate phosphatase|nr:HAD family hydrolase [Clostridiales bacterium]
MNKAVFLDRDGVINEDTGYVFKTEDFRFKDGLFDFCKAAQEKGYLLFIATNQSGIARGYYSESDFLFLTNWMLGRFVERGVNINKLYYCPYHPDGIGKYKRESLDRKPNPGMLFSARNEFNLDMRRSVLIGDKNSDMEAGRRAGVGSLFFLKGVYDHSQGDDVKVVYSFFEVQKFLRSNGANRIASNCQ